MSDNAEIRVSNPASTTRRLERVVRIIGIVLLLAVGAGMGIWIVRSQHQRDVVRKLIPSEQKAPAIDPALFTYRESTHMTADLRDVRGVAVGLHTLYVIGDLECQSRHVAGNSDWRIRNRLTAPPTCMTMADQTVYFGLRDHVELYTLGGKRLARWLSPGKRSYITSLAVVGENLWVADAGARAVLVYNASGKVIRRITGLVAPSPHLDVAAAPDGTAWVTNPGRHRLEQYSADGILLRAWGTASNATDGFCGCCNPTDIAVLPDGRLVTAEKGIPRVKIYRRDGTLDGVVAGSESFAAGTAGFDLAVDGEAIYVLDRAARTIRIFLPKDGAQ